VSAAPSAEFDACVRAYWAFHWGVPPTRRRRVRGPRGIPGTTWQLGRLDGLELADGSYLCPDGRTYLATDRYGQRLWFVGQSPWVIGAGFRRQRIVAVVYWTNKGGRRQHAWRHEFGEGEPGARRPSLTADSEGCAVVDRAGSKYRITWRGIVD
jgi:hypothetical protein